MLFHKNKKQKTFQRKMCHCCLCHRFSTWIALNITKVTNTFIISLIFLHWTTVIQLSLCSKLIQNNAAKSLTGTGKRDYISPILASFHSFLLNSELNLNPSLALSDISKRLHLIILTDHRRQFPFRLQETGIISTFVVWCS